MQLHAILALALLLGAAPATAQQDVTPAQIEELKERIEDIDDWLEDAEGPPAVKSQETTNASMWSN